MPKVGGFDKDALDRAQPTHVTFGAFNAGVVRVLKGFRLFGMYIVAGLGAKVHAVGVFPRLDAKDAQYDKACKKHTSKL
jgi:hypothetical protein